MSLEYIKFSIRMKLINLHSNVLKCTSAVMIYKVLFLKLICEIQVKYNLYEFGILYNNISMDKSKK